MEPAGVNAGQSLRHCLNVRGDGERQSPLQDGYYVLFNEEKQLHYHALARTNISELHHYLILPAKNQIQKRPIETLS